MKKKEGSEFGAGVEGATIFKPSGKPSVKISQDISGKPNMANRLRTTLTHEFGHVHLHGHLFDPGLNSAHTTGPHSGHSNSQLAIKQVCKRDTILETTETDWMEWQAGHVCGAILMPCPHGIQAMQIQDALQGLAGIRELGLSELAQDYLCCSVASDLAKLERAEGKPSKRPVPVRIFMAVGGNGK